MSFFFFFGPGGGDGFADFESAFMSKPEEQQAVGGGEKHSVNLKGATGEDVSSPSQKKLSFLFFFFLCLHNQTETCIFCLLM